MPTLKELGYDVEYYIWTGLFAPRGIPAGVLQTLRDVTRRAVQDDEFKAAMEKAKTPIAYQDTDEFRAFWEADAKRIASVIQFIGKTEAKQCGSTFTPTSFPRAGRISPRGTVAASGRGSSRAMPAAPPS